MSISNDTSRIQYRGDGSVTSFPIPFYFLDDAHIYVYLYDTTTGVETLLTITDDYTLSGEGDQSGGTLTMLVAPETYETLTILREVPIDQLIDYRENERLDGSRLELSLDKLTMIAQQLDELIRRAILLKVTHDGSEVTFPAGGYTTVFAAEITATVSAVDRTFTFAEIEPLAAGGFQTKSGGVTGTAIELVNAAAGWEENLPVNVNIYVHEDSEGTIRYLFETPKPC